MKSKMINRTHVEGVLYQHSLEMKVSGPNSAKPNTEYDPNVDGEQIPKIILK